jgi:hypothetical protein
MNRNLNRRIHPIAEADGLSPKKPRKNPLLPPKLIKRLLKDGRTKAINRGTAAFRAACRMVDRNRKERGTDSPKKG